MTAAREPGASGAFRTFDADQAGAIADPLDYLRLEHERQRAVCEALERLVETMDEGAVAGAAQEILDFLTEDLSRHIADEERDLFPLLEARCPPEDGLKGLLKRLRREHEMDEDLVEFLRADLEFLALGRSLANPTRLLINLREFASTQRRHLAWEDETVLPLAETRLSDADRAAMAERMRLRRR
ncbi:MAG: hemerythrin domain-containing protein [Marivibrio sp.]|uniref:hemerythrin domain-containing protein n=1 Tax=Marivibrio sp. TaxID=2039719 RepID=UPI0032EF3D4A